MGDTMCEREQYWKELDVDKKVERMRTIIKRLENRTDHLESMIELLKRHSHLDNRIVIDLYDGGRGSSSIKGRSINPDEVYF